MAPPSYLFLFELDALVLVPGNFNDRASAAPVVVMIVLPLFLVFLLTAVVFDDICEAGLPLPLPLFFIGYIVLASMLWRPSIVIWLLLEGTRSRLNSEGDYCLVREDVCVAPA